MTPIMQGDVCSKLCPLNWLQVVGLRKLHVIVV